MTYGLANADGVLIGYVEASNEAEARDRAREWLDANTGETYVTIWRDDGGTSPAVIVRARDVYDFDAIGPNAVWRNGRWDLPEDE